MNEKEDSKISNVQKMKEKIKKIFKSNLLSKSAIISVTLYGILGLTQIMYAEVFPIWVWTPTEHQGLGLEPYKIGILQGMKKLKLISFFRNNGNIFIIESIISYL